MQSHKNSVARRTTLARSLLLLPEPQVHEVVNTYVVHSPLEVIRIGVRQQHESAKEEVV